MTGSPARSLVTAVLRPRARQILAGALFGAVATACGAGLLSLAAWLIATAATHPPITALSVAVVLTRALGVGRGVARYAERLVTHDAALRALADARDRVYARLAATEPVRRFRSGDLVSRLVTDTDSVQDLVVRGLAPPVAAALAGSGAVLLSGALLLPGGALLAAGLLLAGLAVPALAAAAGRRPAERTARARSELSTALVDVLHGAPDLIAYGAMDRAADAVRRADDDLTRVARRDARLLGLGAGAFSLVAGLTLAGSLLLGVTAVAGGTLGPIPLAVLVLTALAAFEVVAPLPGAAARLGTVRSGLDRLGGVLAVEPAVRAVPDDDEPIPARGDLRIRGLRVRHRPEHLVGDELPGDGAAQDGVDRAAGVEVAGDGVTRDEAEEPNPLVLDGLDLDVPAGAHVALVGASGSGKSTLASVLFRFLDPESGTVTLGGADLLAHSPYAVRAAVSGVPQDPHVFDSTVRENVRLARPDATDPELRSVLDRVGLAALDLDHGVGAHGMRLSGGMRRRLALARALLTDPALLVLDEPTAHLDPDTRDAVLDDLLTASAGRSVLLITHDPACLRRADTVVTLRDKRLYGDDGAARRAGDPTPYPAPNAS
ncbi:ATP-binding cassette subfamily C protein CydC [Pseudonocardia sediminis]|uniref:ATP-binding cassette subfamily C protein CydC n=1 Tax=Pseudonocardia sediminis TaxID=1397368 RepID=A0A4Q7V1U4_PSEST|nr:ATP-binding cassette domain-containing protein [Pseudonocardia sediminis]RZT86539.1 ATP-binding cassette subfamily C protein CydC [Pseudonocardia sediminis]